MKWLLIPGLLLFQGLPPNPPLVTCAIRNCPDFHYVFDEDYFKVTKTVTSQFVTTLPIRKSVLKWYPSSQNWGSAPVENFLVFRNGLLIQNYQVTKPGLVWMVTIPNSVETDEIVVVY